MVAGRARPGTPWGRLQRGHLGALPDRNGSPGVMPGPADGAGAPLEGVSAPNSVLVWPPPHPAPCPSPHPAPGRGPRGSRSAVEPGEPDTDPDPAGRKPGLRPLWGLRAAGRGARAPLGRLGPDILWRIGHRAGCGRIDSGEITTQLHIGWQYHHYRCVGRSSRPRAPPSAAGRRGPRPSRGAGPAPAASTGGPPVPDQRGPGARQEGVSGAPADPSPPLPGPRAPWRPTSRAGEPPGSLVAALPPRPARTCRPASRREWGTCWSVVADPPLTGVDPAADKQPRAGYLLLLRRCPSAPTGVDPPPGKQPRAGRPPLPRRCPCPDPWVGRPSSGARAVF